MWPPGWESESRWELYFFKSHKFYAYSINLCQLVIVRQWQKKLHLCSWRLCVYVCACLYRSVCAYLCVRARVFACNKYTPYCPISTLLSTHHNMWDMRRKRRNERDRQKMDITAVYLGTSKGGIRHSSGIFSRWSSHWYVVTKISKQLKQTLCHK